jgi:catechol 2,3-dioxygenase-like lactoylglutathione lyase family enzyme
MATDQVTEEWAIRSTLIAVSDLERSVAFYRELGPFEEIFREDAVAVLGEDSPRSIILTLREMRGTYHTRHGQQSLGLRAITFNIGSLGELDRIESVLHAQNHFTSRHSMADGASELLRGRDPDNLPLVFVCYADRKAMGADYYRTIAELFYTLDV